ncbi:MAG: hypothetical protein K2Y71_17220 [Xanthobacteraceae bacterium]|nr:hypothetical protein [Xanthobacteraceae bacterium]
MAFRRSRRRWRSCILALGSALLSGPTAAADRAFGEYLSAECVTCHQLSGQLDGIRSIVGWPERAFVAIMGEYREKKRNSDIMHTIASRLSNEEVVALAAYFGTLRPN